jgi:uncharacterized protein (DUF488 family)
MTHRSDWLSALTTRSLLSVGHSNLDLDHFLDLLQNAGVTAVADVRSSPYSGRLPHFNGPDLERSLRARGIAYVFLGHLLGGRPADPALYDEGRVDYERVRQTDFFAQGLDRLVKGTEHYTVAMLCSEADPLDCHRCLMITPALVERGLAPLHLHRDGWLETTAEMEERLFAETGREAEVTGLFADQLTEEELHEMRRAAYRDMARRRAFQRKEEDGEETD